MLRKLAIVGLGLPLIALTGALVYLFAFGTDEPTFEVASRELARDHTLLQLSDDPPAALVVPTEPPTSVILIVVLADDQRHIWNAARALGLLDLVEARNLALLIAPGVSESGALKSLAGEVEAYVPVRATALAAFDGAPLRAQCAAWADVVAVGSSGPSCGDASLRLVAAGERLGERIVDALEE